MAAPSEPFRSWWARPRGSNRLPGIRRRGVGGGRERYAQERGPELCWSSLPDGADGQERYSSVLTEGPLPRMTSIVGRRVWERVVL